MIYEKIHGFSARALDWLEHAPLNNVKEAAQAARALCKWDRDAGGPVSWLGHARSGDFWDSENPVRDTARAGYALKECGIQCTSSIDWLNGMQSANGSWNDNVYDTCYVLIYLGSVGYTNRPGVLWLLKDQSEDWKHPGTIALINSALIRQDPAGLAGIISGNASWLLDRCQDGHWKYVVTTCLVVQSLALAEKWDYREQTVEWLQKRIEEGTWTVPGAAQVLITLNIYRLHNRKPL